MLKLLPDDVLNIVSKMKHEIELSDVIRQLIAHHRMPNRDIERAFQALARDGMIVVEQYSQGVVGQKVTVLPRNRGEDICEIGHSWKTYNREQMQILEPWSKLGWTDDEWSKNYGEWKACIGSDKFISIRLMIRELPHFSDFNDFEMEIVDFPEFIPITVIVPSGCVMSTVVPLNQHQIAVKYDFEDDIEFARDKVKNMELAENRLERNRHVTELIEFFIVKPTMLVHSYKIRDSIYTKLEEFMAWTDKCDDIKYVHYITDMVERMTNVLSMVLKDPLLCVK
jgi:hypothetical protein